jgi:hypothetical protein
MTRDWQTLYLHLNTRVFTLRGRIVTFGVRIELLLRLLWFFGEWSYQRDWLPLLDWDDDWRSSHPWLRELQTSWVSLGCLSENWSICGDKCQTIQHLYLQSGSSTKEIVAKNKRNQKIIAPKLQADPSGLNQANNKRKLPPKIRGSRS